MARVALFSLAEKSTFSLAVMPTTLNRTLGPFKIMPPPVRSLTERLDDLGRAVCKHSHVSLVGGPIVEMIRQSLLRSLL